MRRLVTAELGAGPLAIARAQRAQTARVLTETTTLPLSEIAFAAGFASIRQFNATIHEVFAVTPTQLREARGRGAAGRARRARRPRRVLAGPLSEPAAPGLIRLRLPYRAPIDLDRMLALPGRPRHPGRGIGGGRPLPADACCCRTARGSCRSARAPARRGQGDPGYIDCELQLEDLRDLTAAVQRCRRLLDLDADPEAVTALPGRPTRCSGRWRWPARGAGRPATWTGTSSRCGPCSASRSRSPRPGGWGRGWWPPTASRSSGRTAR